MGIYGAINTAVSGLTAQATALENISGNVANSQTIGYKRLDTTFSDMVTGGGATQASQVSGTTYATSRATNSVAGDISQNDVDTYLAINGDGYFVVTKAADFIDGSTTFADETFYTRGGDFEVTKEGFFVNSAGYYLQGFPLDETTGNAIGDAPAVVQIDSQPLAARATTRVDYQANLPRVPSTNLYDGSNEATALLDITGAVGAGDVALANKDAFVDASISGGSITVYNQNGSAVNMEIRYAKIHNEGDVASAGPPVVLHPDTWSMYVSAGGTSDPIYHEIGNIAFDSAGAVTTLTNGTSGAAVGTTGFNIPTITVGGVTATNVEISFANGSLTQFSDPDGKASSLSLNQNGYAAGELSGISVDKSGRVIASYSNRQTRAVYEIPLATFEADQELRRVDGAAFSATTGSGVADLTGGGTVIANAVELSNADIADEFSKLIITQQAYSANSKIITSADEMPG